jgi:hypothetical protein
LSRYRKVFLSASIALVIAIGVWLVVHQQSRVPVAPPGGRVIHFPEDRSMGTLLFRDRAVDARGFVVVPPGHEVTLVALAPHMSRLDHLLNRFNLYKPDPPNTDLSPLSALRPDDLDQITLNAIPIPDHEFKNLAYLTGLQDMMLLRTPVSAKALAHLDGLTSLTRLHLYRVPGMTEEALGQIGRIRSLRSLTLDQTPVSGPGLARLTNLTSLESLNLGRTLITNDDLRQLPPLPALKMLILDGGD